MTGKFYCNELEHYPVDWGYGCRYHGVVVRLDTEIRLNSRIDCARPLKKP